MKTPGVYDGVANVVAAVMLLLLEFGMLRQGWSGALFRCHPSMMS